MPEARKKHPAYLTPLLFEAMSMIKPMHLPHLVSIFSHKRQHRTPTHARHMKKIMKIPRWPILSASQPAVMQKKQATM